MSIRFHTIDWENVEKTQHRGETGTSFWQTAQYDALRIRRVEYSKDYFADHWCKKGHIVFCIDGEFVSELESGERFTISKGMMYVVSDDASSHRSVSQNGVILLIVDGDFLM